MDTLERFKKGWFTWNNDRLKLLQNPQNDSESIHIYG